MSTQIFEAMAGKITDEMSLIAQKEGLDENAVLENVKMGKIVILKNNQRKNSIPCAIGENLNVKICANIGSFDFESEIKQELDKVRVIEQIGVDVLMDLSCDKNSDEIRKKVLEASTLPVGSAPLLQTFKTMTDNGENVAKLTKDKILADIEKHCSDGVDFVALECAVTKFVVEQLQKQDRLTGIVSASGGMLANYILVTGLENPLYQYFDEILDILRTYDVTLCLASALVSGSICDATDRAQVAETVVMGELKRISLSLKRMGANPWDEIADKFKEGDVIKGTINKITSFGAFINIYPGVEALLPSSEISDEYVNVNQMFSLGDEVEVLIKKFTPQEHRIGLSIKDIVK